jgi:hypothetical protein
MAIHYCFRACVSGHAVEQLGRAARTTKIIINILIYILC